MINQSTKFEVAMFIHYEDMKGDTKWKNGVVWVVTDHSKSMEIAPLDRAHMSFY